MKPIYWHLIDRAYKIMLCAGYRITEQNADQNDPIAAWMSDARTYLHTGQEQSSDIGDSP